MDAWLQEAVARLGSDEPLSAEDERTLLSLARVAAHDSGERVNAPLLCYLVGVAVGRTGGSLGELAEKAAGEPL